MTYDNEERQAEVTPDGSLLKFMKKGGTKEAPSTPPSTSITSDPAATNSARPINQRLWYRPSSNQHSARPVNQWL
ncbi:hypothetical protein F7725_026455, partial [Dissostichus mawsoni]